MYDMEVFDGVMLGDGSLAFQGRGVLFNISLSGKSDSIIMTETISYLEHLKASLTRLGIEFSSIYPKVEPHAVRAKDGSWVAGCRLSSHHSKFLISQFDRWYTGGELRFSGVTRTKYMAGALKHVPLDLVLTPVTLAYWFMGDGNSYKYHRYSGDKTTSIRLATHAFSVEDVRNLRTQLLYLKLTTAEYLDKKVRAGGGLEIFLLQDSVDAFIEMVKPYVIPPYLYKVKSRC